MFTERLDVRMTLSLRMTLMRMMTRVIVSEVRSTLSSQRCSQCVLCEPGPALSSLLSSPGSAQLGSRRGPGQVPVRLLSPATGAPVCPDEAKSGSEDVCPMGATIISAWSVGDTGKKCHTHRDYQIVRQLILGYF